MVVTPGAIAELGALVGDPGRANMLIALLDGRALTARELADRAGVTPQTASRHLARLLEARLLRMERQGRHHYHRLASVEVAQMLEAMHVAGAAAGDPAPRAVRTGPADERMREARSCYDHLAGRLAVRLAEVLAASDSGDLRLKPDGERRLAAWGLDLCALRGGKRVFCRGCLDWSERRPHLGGALGGAVLDRALAMGWLRRQAGTRALEVSPAGRLGLREHFGLRGAEAEAGA